MSSTLSIKSADLYYGAAQALYAVTIECKPGKITAVLGRNGVGKSSTLRAVTGINHVAAGHVVFDNEVLKRAPPYKRARLGIGYVPQGREIFPLLTVKENLETGYAGLSGKDKSIPDYIFTLFPVLKSMLGRRGGDLSGGQQQQLAIGRALGSDPSVLILDEPTEGIQPNIVHEIGDIIIGLAQEGLAVLLVEQKLPFARRVGNLFCIMDRGRTVAEGKMSELNDDLVRRHLVV